MCRRKKPLGELAQQIFSVRRLANGFTKTGQLIICGNHSKNSEQVYTTLTYGGLN